MQYPPHMSLCGWRSHTENGPKKYAVAIRGSKKEGEKETGNVVQVQMALQCSCLEKKTWIGLPHMLPQLK